MTGEICVECDQPATHHVEPIGKLCTEHWKAQMDIHRAWLNTPIGDEVRGKSIEIAFHGAKDEDIE